MMESIIPQNLFLCKDANNSYKKYSRERNIPRKTLNQSNKKRVTKKHLTCKMSTPNIRV